MPDVRGARRDRAVAHLLVPALAAQRRRRTRSRRPTATPASRCARRCRVDLTVTGDEARRRRGREARAPGRRASTARATSSASTPAPSSRSSRATGSRTSSRTTCPTSSSTTRTSPGATRPRRADGTEHRLRPWLALVVLSRGRVRRRQRTCRAAAAVLRAGRRSTPRRVPAGGRAVGLGARAREHGPRRRTATTSLPTTWSPCCRG